MYGGHVGVRQGRTARGGSERHRHGAGSEALRQRGLALPSKPLALLLLACPASARPEPGVLKALPTLSSRLPLPSSLHSHLRRSPACVQVPFRRVSLAGGSGVFDLYDTSGPQVLPELYCKMYSSSTAGNARRAWPTAWSAEPSRSIASEGCLRGPPCCQALAARHSPHAATAHMPLAARGHTPLHAHAGRGPSPGPAPDPPRVGGAAGGQRRRRRRLHTGKPAARPGSWRPAA